jgi:hypothetical protein
MQQKKYYKLFFIIAAVVLFTFTVVNCIAIISAFATNPDKIGKQQKNLKIKAFKDVNKALASKTQVHNFIFKGSFASPFRPLSGRGVTHRKTGKTVKPVYKKLTLKGTLIKEGALAIIEDEDGKTYICRQGEKVHNREIMSVGDDKVTIKDANGTTILRVKE